jgi:predicted nucleotidyltransferase
MFVNSDFSDLLRLFNDNQVKYLVIGGYALIQYAEPRYTKDLDIWISTDTENARAVYRALREFGAPLAGLTEADFAQEGYFYQMGVPPVRVDILMGIPGVNFAEAWPRRTEVDFDGLVVPFIGREDLIASKLASGRPQDLLDVEHLTRAASQSAKGLSTSKRRKARRKAK